MNKIRLTELLYKFSRTVCFNSWKIGNLCYRFGVWPSIIWPMLQFLRGDRRSSLVYNHTQNSLGKPVIIPGVRTSHGIEERKRWKHKESHKILFLVAEHNIFHSSKTNMVNFLTDLFMWILILANFTGIFHIFVFPVA